MIYVVSLYYLPLGNPPATRMGHLVRFLVDKYGAENVRVVTGRPNYPDGKLRPEHRWKLFCRETGKYGETVDHIYELPAPFKGLYRKTLGLLSFAASLFVYFLFRRLRKGDVVLVTSGPIFPVYSILFLSYLKRRLRYVVDVRDLWPQVVAGMGFTQEDSLIYRSLLALAEASYRRADSLIGNSPGICEYLVETAPGKSVEMLLNPVDMELFKPLPDSERDTFRREHADVFPEDGRPVFVFSGTFANYIGLTTVFDAWRMLLKKNRKFRFIMIGQGEGEPGIRKFIAEQTAADQIVILPFMDRDKLVKYIGAADFCFASLRDSPMLRYAIPTKLIEYLACDKQVVAVVSGSFAAMLQESDVAYVCQPGNARQMADALVSLIESGPRPKSKRGPRNFINEHFSLKTFCGRAESIFDGVVSLQE